MEPPTALRMSPEKARPLYPLSPERINRNVSTATTASKTSRTTETDYEYDEPRTAPASVQLSPTRKANLFADYHPTTPKATTSGFALPQSPSLPEIHALRSHVRTNSDVQGLVKRFEHLDVRNRDAESAERRRKHEAELRRAQIAREEAESDVRRYREELRRMKKDGEEGRERERKVARRLEVVMEEYASAKDQHASQSAVYEKELRKARKEAYKNSSAVIKLQEELKSTRGSLRNAQSSSDAERQKVQRREQDTFSAQYQLAALQEELDKLRAHLKIVEEEKIALKQSLKDEEVARVAAEGMIALPVSQDDDDRELMSSPGKRSPLSDDKENAGPVAKKIVETKRLEERIRQEQMRREHAEEMIDFLQMECQFRCCRCQTESKRHGHDNFELAVAGELSVVLEQIMQEMKAVMRPPGKVEDADEMDVEPTADEAVVEVQNEAEEALADPVLERVAAEDQVAREAQAGEDVDEDVDRSMTMTADEEAPMAPHPTPAEPVIEEVTTATVPSGTSPPSTPIQAHQTAPFRHHNSIRTVTTTTTIPMHFTPISKPPALLQHAVEDAENIPPSVDSIAVEGTMEMPFDRAAALAAIEYRRGRAKSFQAGNLTPRKQMLEGVGVNGVGRRDISAPALGGKVGGVNYAKGAGSVGRAGRRMA